MGSEQELLIRYVDGEPTMIRDKLRLTGSNAVFEVDDGVARLRARRGPADLDALDQEISKLPFIDEVVTEVQLP